MAWYHSIEVTATDSLGNTTVNSFTINIEDVFADNSAPDDLTLSASLVNENAANGTIIGSVSVSDADPDDTHTFGLEDDAGGRFTIDANSGVLSVANGLLLDFEDQPAHAITIRVTDSASNIYDEVVTITLVDVNEAPAAIDSTVSADEDTSYALLSADFSFTDVDDGDSLASVQITALESVGALTLSGVDVTLNQVITAADIAAGNLIFDPVADANGTAYDSFTFSVNDGEFDSVASYTMTVDVAAVNDAPVNTVPGTQTVDEATSTVISGISVSDVDAGASNISTRLQVAYGALDMTLSGSAIISAGSNGTGDLTLQGTIADINTTLASLNYTGYINVSGAAADTITVTSNDLGHTGSGGALSDIDTIQIDITAVNNAPSFVIGDGAISTTQAGVFDYGTAITTQADGKVLVVGHTDNGSGRDLYLIRYNADGSLDTSFSGDGLVALDAGTGDNFGTGVTVQSDGKILVTGYQNNGSDTDFTVARFNSDGSVDTAFGSSGLTAIDFGNNDLAYSVAVQNDGRIVIAGQAHDGSNTAFGIARLNADGTLDTTFSGDGLAMFNAIGFDYTGNDLSLLGNGQLLMVGQAATGSGDHLALMRINSDGTLDTGFDTDGILTTDIAGVTGDSASAVAIQGDGKMLVGGFASNGSDNDIVLVRYNTDGSLDTSFDTDGVLTTDLSGTDDSLLALAVQYDGKIIVVGSTNNGSDDDYAIIRYNSDGSLDTRFDSDGILSFGGSDTQTLQGVALTNNGDIIAVGASDTSGAMAITVHRFTADGQMSVSFDTQNTLDGNPTFVEDAAAVVFDTDVAIYDPELSALDHFNGATLTLERNGGADADDVFSASGLLSALTESSTLTYNGTDIGTVTSNSAGTLVLTFDANATNALVNSAMQAIAYSNTNNTPPASVQIDWTLSDQNSGAQGSGGALTASGSTTVAITATNDAPTLTSIEGADLAYTENDGNTTITSALALGDVDDTDLESATISISANYVDGEDVLGFADQNGISGAWDSVTGTLTLTGTSSVANYQTALRSVTYTNSSDDPSTATRTVSFVINDGDVDSNTQSRDIAMTAVNDAPVAASIEGADLAYTENNGVVAITSALVLSDVDDTDLESATVTITTNYVDGEDVLAFADQNGITGSWDSGTGVLTLSGTSSVAHYQTALRSVTYNNTSDDLSTATRTVSFVVNDGDIDSNSQSRDIAITAVNDAPVGASIEGADLAYTENDGAVAITSALVLSDVDDTNLESATVTISANYINGEDVLTFAAQNGITGSWDSGTGVLTLSGTSSIANYQTALRSVTYSNTSDNPSTTTRTVSFVVNDGDVDSNVQSRDIAITAVNDASVLASIESADLAYTENDGAVTITSALVLSDVDDTDLESATVTISANYVNGEDVLAFADQNGITGSWDSGTGVLTLSGTSSVANYQTALRSVTYTNTSDDLNTATRTVSFVVNDGDVDSNTQSRDIAISAVNDAPVAGSIESADLAYTENDGAIAITSALVLSDVDDTDLESATVTISANYVNGEDVLAFADQNGITGSWDSATGVLTLSGTSSVANYQTALRSVTYTNTSDDLNTATRTVSFVVNDGDVDSNTQSRDIAMTAVNDAPVAASIENADIAYTENDGATAITSALVLSDIDDTDLESATVTISANYVNGEDVLAFADQNGITGSWDSATGVLTLSGTSSVANYQTALRSVTYTNTSDDLNTATRTVSFVVNDGDVDSNAQSRDIAISAVNDAPVAGSIESADLAYTENDGAVAITSALVLSDVDDTDLESATVTLSANYVNGEDVLTFADQNGITGSWDSSTGILTLTGTSSVANYQTALRSVTYTNTSDDLNTATRTVSFVVNDGDVNSNAQSRDIAISAVNDAPVAGSIESADIAYTENDGAVAITSALVLSDVDDTDLELATVTLSANYVNGEDVLTFADQNGITGSWDSSTGILTLTGTSSVANYQTALRSVTYTNTSDDLNTATRTVSFVVNDGDVDSNAQSRDIAINAVNDAPVASTIESANIAYTENDGAVAITSALVLSDVDDTDLESATVTISANYVNGEDVLTFADQNGITGSWDSSTGTLTLTGTSSVANYQTALRSVTYTNTSDDLNTATRTVSFVVNDGDVNSNAQSRDIAISAVNDAPVAGSIESADIAYTENDGAVAITSALVLSDVDDTDLESATVTLSANYVNGEDVLTFADQNGITGSWDSSTGILTLTGTSSVANYQTALRSVTYTNTSDDLNTATRTVSFVVNDGDVDSNAQSRDIAINAVNDAPVASTIESANIAYTENDGAVAITSALVLSDVDDTDLESATVTISANYVNGEDVLTFADQNGITGSWDSSTGILTLTGTSSVANYQTALRSVTYTNISDDLNTATRTVSFVVNDGDVDSNTQSRDIAITAVNDAPVAGSIENADLAYTENDGAVAITSALVLSDVDDTNLESATVTLSANYVNGEDVLTFADQNGITGSWDSGTGILTLTGTSSVANYQTALRSVTYTNTSDDLNTATRTVSFVVNDGDVDSNAQSRDIAISAVNDAPVAGSIESADLAYTENDGAVAITSALVLNDVDDTNLESATVTISANYANGEDVLTFADQNGITGSWDSSTGILTLTGTSSVANYQTALRSVTYTNTSDDLNTATRTVSFVVNDGDVNSNAQSRDIAINVVNDAPVASAIESANIAYTENDGAVAITSALVLNDIDDTDLESATVTLSANYVNGEDVLTFADQNGITGSWDSGTGILTLTGTSSVAHYQTALRSVTYTNTSDDLNTATRTVSFVVNDGDVDSNAQSRDIAISAVNDAPVAGSIESANIAYTENDGAVAISSALVLSDVDDTDLESATVTISANYVNGEDVLTFTDQNGITGSWDSSTGILTLTGTSSVANYQTALRSVTYTNTSDDLNTATRTVSFVVNDGDVNSNAQSRDIAVTAVNDAPVAGSIESADLAYTENDGAVAITSALVLSDVDDTDLESATVTISANYVNGEDLLTFTDQNGITGSWDSSTGILTLTGTSSVANYQTALRSVTYTNTSDDLNTATRTVSFIVNDGDVNSNAQSRDIAISAVNDAPVAGSIESADIAYTENDGAVAITSALVLSDVDDTDLESATVTLSANYVNGEDVLTFADQNGITGSWDSSTGILTLTGTSSVANYQTALRSVTYTNTSDDLNTATRTVSFVVNDGDVNSNAQSRDIAITAVNDAPVAGSIESADLAYTENDGAVAITSALVLSDIDDTDLESATVTISANYVNSEDVLTFADQNGITGSWDSSTGILTLSGTSSVANYQTALRSVTYTNTSDDLNTATRTVSFVVNDGDVDSNVQSRDIAITAVNDAPVAGSIESADLAYTENDGTVAITSALVLSDVDDTDLESATVTISANYVNGEDLLTFTDQNGITGSWDSSTGILTLTGTSSVAHYQTALRSITYTNTSDDLNTATRTVSFVVNDGDVNSNAQSRDIAINAVNDAPVAGSIESANIAYTENDGAVAITSALVLSDVDDTDLESATVTISANYVNGEDVLTFVDQNGITGSWDSGTGVLTLSGTSSATNYQTALRSVTYTNTSDDLNTATRTVSFVVNDGDVNSNAQSRDIAMTAVNDAPVAGSIESADLAYTENDGAVATTSALVLSDVDDTDLESATVTISANYVNGEDLLTFADQNGITGSWDSGTGILTLTGTSSTANYQTALRSVTYTNTSDDLSTATRTVSFVVNDGDVDSNTQSRDIAISAVNDAPVAGSIESADIAYTENDGAVTITSALVLSDVDDTDLESATVTLSANYVNGEDVLTFVDQNGITGSWNSGTGVLTLSGTSSVANYQTALRSVTYTNTSDDLNTATRTVSFVVNDGDVDSNAQSRDIAITAVNDAPVAGSIESADLAYTENDGAVAITSALVLSDVDDTDLESATVTLSANYVNGEDVLTFADQNGITGSWDSSTGILTLTGTSSVANYQTALRSVTYTNTSDDLSTATRTVSFVVNDGDVDSNAQSRDIAITAVNDAPVAGSIESADLAYTENDGAVAITSALVLSDVDDTDLESATVTISANYVNGEDVLTFADQNGITGSWDSGTGILTLTGTSSVANYQTALRSVTYTNTSDDLNTATRTVSFVVNDGDVDSNAQSRDIAISAVNDAPVAGSIESADIAYTENDGAVVITSALVLSDVDDTDLESATVTISANYVNGEDVLTFADQNGITGSWDSSTGILTLTGTSSVANYQTALRSVTYTNTSDDPDTVTRTIRFAVNDGDVDSNAQSRDIAITAVNDASNILSIETHTLSYIENDGAVSITASLTLSDFDDVNLESAAVSISSNYVNGEDALLFIDQNGITGSWDSGTGVLTLNGSSSVAHYQTALRSVAYSNTADNPNTAIRTISFTVNDGDVHSNTQSRNIVFNAVNDAPVAASIEVTDLVYTENDGAVATTSALVLSDVDDADLESATVAISANYVNGEDVLAFTDQNGIAGSWDASSGVLTLTGTSSVSHYQAALRSVTYTNTSDNPDTTTRTVSFVVNDGELDSNAQSRGIAITAVNDAPIANAIEGADLAYTENDGAVTITSALALDDFDDTDLESATITISANYINGEDVLDFVDQNGITGSWDASTGTLTLTGTSSVAHYQAALRSVTYTNTSDDLNTATRTVDFVVNDGDVNSNTQSRDIAITAVNDAPVTASIEGLDLAYTENDGAVAITSALLISDVDDVNLESATVAISANYASGEDVLAFVDQNGISGAWNSSTGVLTLTGTSSVANYQAALRSVSFENIADNPSTATRTVSIAANDGDIHANTQSRNIAFSAVNDAPVASSIESVDLAYTENDGAVAITSSLILSDVDDTHLESATVTISANYIHGEDVLALTDQNGITGSWDSSTGVLTLTGTSTVANFQAALRSVTYTNTSDDPNTSTRTFIVVVNDGDVDSNSQSRDMAITVTNDAPVAASIEAADLAYTENDSATVITTTLTLHDVDDTHLESARVTISGDYVESEDVLAFIDQNGISGSWDASTGILTLSGNSTVANYQTALRSVTYQNTADDPDTRTRTVTFTVNDGDADSNLQSRGITIAAVNDAPVASSIEGTALAYTENDVPTAITTALVLNDLDDTHFESATVAISTHYVNGEDSLTFTDQNGITGSWDSSTGTLTLSGTSSVSHYQAALRSVTYHNTSDAPDTAPRTVTITVHDGDSPSNAQSRVISVTPVNDTPVIGGINTGLVIEDDDSDADRLIEASGTLTIVDPDTGESLFQAGTITGTYGTLTLDTTGLWHYSADNTQAVIQQLDRTETLTEGFSVSAFDGTSHTITLTLEGTEDEPVITGTITGTVAEDGVNSASGTLSITDTDTSDNPVSFVDQAATLSDNGYGQFAITAGTWQYTLNNDHAVVQALGDGESLDDRYTFTATDGSTQTVTLTIDGTGDAPIITGSPSGTVIEDGTLTTTQVLAISDTDAEDNPVGFIEQTPTLGDAGYGHFSLSGSQWNYTLDNTHPGVQALDTGESLLDAFTFSATDGSTQSVAVAIQGVEDAPVLAGRVTGTVEEDGTLSATGALSISDVDTSDNPVFFLDQADTLGSFGYGLFSLNDNTWHYTLDNEYIAVQAMDAGETLTDHHTFIASDGSTTQVTITLHGAEDPAVITSTNLGAVVEDGLSTAAGDISISDVDASDQSVHFPNQGATPSDRGYGTFTLNDDVWEYTLDHTHAAIQALDVGEQHTDTLTFTATDGSTETITITIHGTDDAAVIGGVYTGTVKEDDTTVTTGTLTISDIDTSDAATHFDDQAPTLGDQGYGRFSLTGETWRYALDNTHALVQALDAGQTLSDSHTFMATDGSTQIIQVTIEGSEDAPVVIGTFTASVAEDSITEAYQVLAISDVDTQDNPVSFADQGLMPGDNGYGHFALTNGTWRYVLDNEDQRIQSLGSADTLLDTFTFTATDSSTQTVTVTIQGTWDTAVIVGDIEGSITEDSNTPTGGTLALHYTDARDQSAFLVDQAAIRGDHGYGYFAMTEGLWTYTLDNAHPAVQALDVGETLQDTFTIGTSNGLTQLLTITIDGQEDAPLITGTFHGITSEDNTLTTSGALHISDVDTRDNPVTFTDQSNVLSDQGYGTFDLADGVWTYTLNNEHTDVQALDVGESLVDQTLFTATDASTQSVSVSISGTEDAPVIAADNTGTVTEDQHSSVSGTLRITDVDTNDNPVFFADQPPALSDAGYGTVSVSDHTWHYTLDHNHRAVQALDVDEQLIDTARFTATDGSTQTLTITIEGTEDLAVIEGITTGTVIEDQALMASGTLSIIDIDFSDNPVSFPDQTPTRSDQGYGTVALTAGLWVYQLDPGNNTVQALNSDESLTDTYTFTASDGNTQTISVLIEGTNDTPIIVNAHDTSAPVETQQHTGGTVNENAAPGTPVSFTAKAVDVDSDSRTFSYQLNDTSALPFAIDSLSGLITTTAALDAESNAVYTLEISATSSDGSQATQTFDITVVDVNEFSVSDITTTDGKTSALLTDSLLAGQPIGITVQAYDADLTNNTVTYTLSENADGQFGVDANTGEVRLVQALQNPTLSEHMLQVVATSSDGSSSEQNLTVTVVPRVSTDGSGTGNGSGGSTEPTPIIVPMTLTAGQPLGVFTLPEGLDTGRPLTYTLVDNPDGLFAIDQETGVLTVTRTPQAHEAGAQSVTVQASDPDQVLHEQSFTAYVTPVLTPSANSGSGEGVVTPVSVTESTGAGAPVGIVSLTPDPTVTYALTDSADGRFAVDANSGIVSLAQTLDAETSLEHRLTLTATTRSGDTTLHTLTIQVADVDEFAPSEITDRDGQFGGSMVAETTDVGDQVGITASAFDADRSNDVVAYTLTDNANGQFDIDTQTGIITLAAPLNNGYTFLERITIEALFSDGTRRIATFDIEIKRFSTVTTPTDLVVNVDQANSAYTWVPDTSTKTIATDAQVLFSLAEASTLKPVTFTTGTTTSDERTITSLSESATEESAFSSTMTVTPEIEKNQTDTTEDEAEDNEDTSSESEQEEDAPNIAAAQSINALDEPLKNGSQSRNQINKQQQDSEQSSETAKTEASIVAARQAEKATEAVKLFRPLFQSPKTTINPSAKTTIDYTPEQIVYQDLLEKAAQENLEQNTMPVIISTEVAVAAIGAGVAIVVLQSGVLASSSLTVTAIASRFDTMAVLGHGPGTGGGKLGGPD